MELRPLSLGEIFARTATMYARNFLPFALITLAITLPLSFVQYALDRIAQPQLDQLLALLQRPPVHGAVPLQDLAISPSLFGVEALSGLLAYAGWTVAFVAVAAGVALLYAGMPVTFGASYSAVLQAWRRILATLALGVLVLLAWDVLQTILALLLVGATFSTAQSVSVVTALAGLCVSTIMVMTFALLVVTLAFASYGVVLGGKGARTSLRESFARIFARTEMQRAMLASIAVCLTILAATVGVNAIAVAGGHAGWGPVVALPEALLRAAVAPFPAIALAAYYFDVRIRHEGYDIELGLARIASGETSPEDSGYAPTAYLSGTQRAVIKRFLERRGSLDAVRRIELARRLAAPVRELVPPDLERLEDEPLLERL